MWDNKRLNRIERRLNEIEEQLMVPKWSDRKISLNMAVEEILHHLNLEIKKQYPKTYLEKKNEQHPSTE